MLKGRALPLKSLFSYIFRTSPLKNPSGFKDIKYFIINNPPLIPYRKIKDQYRKANQVCVIFRQQDISTLLTQVSENMLEEKQA